LGQAQAAVKQVEDGIRGATVARDKAKLDFDRATALYAKQSLTKIDMDGARAQLDGAQAQLDGAQAQMPLARERIAGAQALVEEAELAVKDTVITSPIDAILLKRVVEVGSLVGPGTPTFILADVRSLKAIFGAPDAMLSKIRVGMTLPFTSDAIPGTFSGRVTTIAPVADPKSRVFNVEVVFDGGKGAIKPGMVVSLQLPVAGKKVENVVVPMNAIAQGRGGPADFQVFVVDEQGGKATVHARKVALGGALKSRLIVADGLKAGEKVVVTGTALVQDGETVQLVP
jgi:multidrug efflux system membrane fusion protein